MASIAAAVAQIKHDPSHVLTRPLVENLCRDLGYVWRQRELDPATTVGLFIQQIAHGNVPCAEVRHLAHQDITASAYCQARQRLPLALLQRLSEQIQQAAGLPQRAARCPRWHGHRTWHIDASSFSMADTPELRRFFGLPTNQREGCGFPTAHLLVLFDAASGTLSDVILSPRRTGDLQYAPDCHKHLGEGDILIGDDCFGSYAHIALLRQAKKHALFPLHHARIACFTPHRPYVPQGQKNLRGLPYTRWVRSLGWQDQVVEWFKPKVRPRWCDEQTYAALPNSILVREVRRTVRLRGGRRVTVTIVTTLLDARRYPAKELIHLRLRRWDVETNIGHLKTTMKMDLLRCKSVQGVRKEVAVFQLVYNLVRLVMLEAATRQRVEVQRISFADTLHWLKHARSGEELSTLHVNLSRPERLEPRAVKRRPKEYDRMTKPRQQLRDALKNQQRNA
jgi:hypothetical protein